MKIINKLARIKAREFVVNLFKQLSPRERYKASIGEYKDEFAKIEKMIYKKEQKNLEESLGSDTRYS